LNRDRAVKALVRERLHRMVLRSSLVNTRHLEPWLVRWPRNELHAQVPF
jgi:hypothetical protein